MAQTINIDYVPRPALPHEFSKMLSAKFHVRIRRFFGGVETPKGDGLPVDLYFGRPPTRVFPLADTLVPAGVVSRQANISEILGSGGKAKIYQDWADMRQSLGLVNASAAAA